MTINVFEQYFAAEAECNGIKRNAALVMLVSDSEAGHISYVAMVTFFPHNTEDDFAVSYDACFSKVLYEGKGRRSKKREQSLLDELQPTIDTLVQDQGKVFWTRSLREARRG